MHDYLIYYFYFAFKKLSLRIKFTFFNHAISYLVGVPERVACDGLSIPANSGISIEFFFLGSCFLFLILVKPPVYLNSSSMYYPCILTPYVLSKLISARDSSSILWLTDANKSS